MSTYLTSLILSLSSKFPKFLCLFIYHFLFSSNISSYLLCYRRHTVTPSHRHIVTPSQHYLCSSSPCHNYLTSAQAHRHVVTSSLLQLTDPLLQLAFISVNGEEEDSRRRRKRGEKE
ncbi:hypothetical protein Bca4012_042927 [Brassica carinata]